MCLQVGVSGGSCRPEVRPLFMPAPLPYKHVLESARMQSEQSSSSTANLVLLAAGGATAAAGRPLPGADTDQHPIRLSATARDSLRPADCSAKELQSPTEAVPYDNCLTSEARERQATLLPCCRSELQLAILADLRTTSWRLPKRY